MAVWNPDEYDQTIDSESDIFDDVIQDVVAPAERTSNVYNSAVKRIEEANLFKTLITSDIFTAGSASPEILASVNGRIKQFATEQLEQLLGMSKPAETKVVNAQFSDKEVEILRGLAGKVLNNINASQTPKVPELRPIAIEPQLQKVQIAMERPVTASLNTKPQAPVKTQPAPQKPPPPAQKRRKPIVENSILRDGSAPPVLPKSNAPGYKPLRPSSELTMQQSMPMAISSMDPGAPPLPPEMLQSLINTAQRS